MDKKDYARAALEFKNAARLAPHDAEPPYWLGLASLDSGDYRSGVALLLRAIELDPRHTGAQLKIAELSSGASPEEFGGTVLELAERRLSSILAAWGGQTDDAAGGDGTQTKDLEQLAARNPRDHAIRSRLFRAYMLERRFPEAERLIDSALAQNQAQRKRAERIDSLKNFLISFWKRFVNEPPAGEDDGQSPDADKQTDDTGDVLQVETTADLEKQHQIEEDAVALRQRAHLYLVTARAKEAEQDLLQSLHLNPRDGLAHYLMSRVHQVHGAEHARREELARALESDPDWLAVRLDLARMRTESGEARAALSLLEQAPKPQHSVLAFIAERNRALLALGDWQALRQSLVQGLTVAKTPGFLLQQGLLYLHTHDPAGARKYLDMALELDPQNLVAINTRSESYLAQNRPDLALSSMREHVQRHPDSAGLQYMLGVWLLRLNHPDEAKAAFQAVLHAYPGFLPALERLLDLDIAARDNGAASQTIASIATAPGGSEPAELARGVMEERPGGNVDSAIAHYRSVLNIDPDNIVALNNLAYHLAGDNNHADEALSLALRVKKLEPANASVDDTIGWAYYNKGSYSLALGHFQTAVAKQPNARREYHLAMAYLKTGTADKARATLREALKMDSKAPEAPIARELIEGASKP
jgi:tetratricopeptide (TPR) repeat protein